jgi:prepilin-type processing-associated H-X9-DG protein
LGTSPSATPPSNQTSSASPNVPALIVNAGPSLIGVIGIILMGLGILGACYFFFIFSTAVQVPTSDFMGTTIGGGYVNNIGLMADRQNGILFSFGIAMIGCFLFFLDRSNANRQPITDKQKKGLLYGGAGVVVAFVPFVMLLAFMGNHVKNTFDDSGVNASSSSSKMDNASDLSSLKQLALACFNYEEKNGDTMPDMTSAETFKDAVTPYVDKSSTAGVDIFAQSGTNDLFQPNPSLSKMDIGKISDPSSIVEIYQKVPYSDGSLNVAFADGHCKLITAEAWLNLKQQSQIP